MDKKRILLWIRAVRAPFLTASIVPVLLGTAFAYGKGLFDLRYFIVALVGMCCLHMGCNLANDYYDHKNRDDWVNRTPTPFSGGSRIIQEGLLTPESVLRVALSLFFLGMCMGIYLCLVRGWELFIIGFTGVFLAFFYSAPPFWLASTGFGELAVGIGFGVLPVLGSYFVQTGELFNAQVVLLSLPVTLLIAAVVYINEFPDYLADREVKKKTIIVRLGTGKAVAIYNLIIVMTYLLVALLLILRILPLPGILAFLTLPLALKITGILRLHHDHIPDLIAGNAGTIQLHLIIGIVMSLSIVVSRVW